MSYNHVVNIIAELRANLSAAGNDTSAVCKMLVSFIAKHFKASNVLALNLESNEISAYSNIKNPEVVQSKPICSITKNTFPFFISDIEKSRAPQETIDSLRIRKFKSFAATLIYSNGKPKVILEIAQSEAYFKWRKEDMFLLEQICSLLDISLTDKPHVAELLQQESNIVETTESSGGSYQRLAQYGNLIFLKISTSFQILEILGDTKKMLGVESKQLLKNFSIWQRLTSAEDMKRLRREFARMRFMHHEFKEEIRIKASSGRQERLIYFQVLPISDVNGKTLFWEGFAIDITDKRNAEQELRNQSKRIEALYEVAQSMQVYHDPALVMLKGLRALIKATNSDCGLGCFYDSKNKTIELAALEGLSQNFMQELQLKINDSKLINQVLQKKQLLLLKNIQEEPLAAIALARKEGLKSTLIVPLLTDDQVRGALVLYCKREDKFTENDANLVSAAATQIAIASRQAEYFIAEKQQSQYMTLLYRISHELSKYATPKEIAQHSIPLIQKQFACKRIWVGVMNEQSTHLVGMAGFGPGVRQRLIDMQIELYLRHDFLDEALRTAKAIVVKEGQQMECSGLNNIIARLQIGTFVIIPLVSLNQPVGAIIIEPAVSSHALIEKNLSLLNTISQEIAATILGRKFESKIAESEKMRMAGLLASGVAHNFNNLLQAVMGQASLLEMQLPKDSTLSKSAHTIVEAAGKGASLVSQLLNFSSQESHLYREIAIKDFFEESLELYESLVGSEVTLEIVNDQNIPQIKVDYSQVQQVMSNLLINAKDAVVNQKNKVIRVRACLTRLLSGEINPELAPGEFIRIDIEDNGIGMDEERQKRCFEPFYSSKHFNTKNGIAFDGSGLGLSYAYSVMKQHNGIITVRSHVGKGTVFSLYFPVLKAQVELAKHDRAKDIIVSQRRLVYLCELDNSILETVKPIFESMSLSCAKINSNIDVAKIVPGKNETISAILIDVDKDSFETIPFLQKIHKQSPEVLMVILTQDIRRWSNILSSYENLYAVSKPLNVWGIHALARKIVNAQKISTLNGHTVTDLDHNNTEQVNNVTPSKNAEQTEVSKGE